MKYARGTVGRIFFVRFEHGEDILEKIRELAEKESISLATITLIGALKDATIVCGPSKPEIPPEPVFVSFDDGREVLGIGTLVRRKDGIHPHIHGSFGKGEQALTGCLRKDCRTFITIEALITEVSGVTAERKKDDKTGIELLSFD
jgi:uncharacterized protein